MMSKLLCTCTCISDVANPSLTKFTPCISSFVLTLSMDLLCSPIPGTWETVELIPDPPGEVTVHQQNDPRVRIIKQFVNVNNMRYIIMVCMLN